MTCRTLYPSGDMPQSEQTYRSISTEENVDVVYPAPLVAKGNAEEKNKDDLARKLAEECDYIDETENAVATAVGKINENASEAPSERPEAGASWIPVNQAATEQRPDETRNTITSSQTAKRTLPRKIQLSQLRTSGPSLPQLQKTSTLYGPLEYLTRTSIRSGTSYRSVPSRISHLSIYSSLSSPFPSAEPMLNPLTHPSP